MNMQCASLLNSSSAQHSQSGNINSGNDCIVASVLPKTVTATAAADAIFVAITRSSSDMSNNANVMQCARTYKVCSVRETAAAA
jgi:uncharacterized UBP type Zn finger protein